MNNQPGRVIPEVDRKKTVKISRKEELVILWIELYGWYIKRLMRFSQERKRCTFRFNPVGIICGKVQY
jgi:hypothetical protein